MKRIRRESLAILLVFLHLFVTPCATAMLLMPADMDCQHCQTGDNPDACSVASAATGSVMEGVAFDSGRADPLLRVAQFTTLLPAALTPTSSEAMLSAQWPRFFAPHYSGDPPLYLVLGQLRI